MQVDRIQNPNKQWRYFVPGGQIGWGAVVHIDSSGLFLSYSDWGVYGYRWTSPGDAITDFREFFLRCQRELGYFRQKLAPHRVFDADATTDAIRARIRELRREKHISKDRARKEWELASCFSNEAECMAYWHERTELDSDDTTGLAVYTPDPQAVAFCEHILPKLAELIRAELEQEKRKPATSPPLAE